MKRLVLFLLLAVSSNAQQSVYTNFPATESPISQGSTWLNGQTNGTSWTNINTTPGKAIGTMPGNASAPQQFADSTATKTGTWGATQQARATVFVTSAPSGGGVFAELEVRLRTTITSGSITGYEINCSVVASDPYMQIVRWNGALGGFTLLNSEGTTGCANGDVITATINGSTITAFKNGTQTVTTTDSTYTTGTTGIGAFLQGTTGVNSNYGLSDFAADDGVPVSTTTAASSITATTASSGGNVLLDGQSTVSARGVAYGTSANPTIAGTHTSNGTGTGSFTSSLTSLTASTTYHVRAYATNSTGTAYGPDLTFTTTAGPIAATCATADVQTAINAATQGQTVTIPACSSGQAWSSGVTISGKGIILTGSGSGRNIAFSSSTLTLGTGSKTLTIGSLRVDGTFPLGPTVGQSLIVSETGNKQNFMIGTVTSITGSTLVMNMTSSGGTCGTGSSAGSPSNCARWLISTRCTTCITHNSSSATLFSITEDSSFHTILENIEIDGGSGTSDYIDLIGGGGAAIVVENMRLAMNGAADVAIHGGVNRGVISNISCDSTPFSQAPICVDPQPFDAAAWSTSSFFGTNDTNGQHNLFVETSDFDAFLLFSDNDEGARTVYRYSVLDNAGLGGHGADTGPFGARTFEFYNNVGIFNGYNNGKTFPMNQWMFVRGGTFVFDNNTMPALTSTDYGTKLDINMTVMNLQRNAGTTYTACWARGTTGGADYFAPHQVGLGCATTGCSTGSGGTGLDGRGNANYSTAPFGLGNQYVGDSEPAYIWGNSRQPLTNVGDSDYGSGQGDSCTGTLDTSSNYIVANRDFFNGATAKPGYTPYTYPHPLVGGTVVLSSITVLPNPASTTIGGTVNMQTSSFCTFSDSSTIAAGSAGCVVAWSNTNAHSSINSSTGVVTGASAGSDTVTATLSPATPATATVNVAGAPVVATPTASPVAGTYTGFQTVTLSTTTAGATICFTVDGTTPTATTPGTCSHGTTYSAPFLVDASKTVLAIGTLSGDTNSAQLSAVYVINHQNWYVRSDGGTITQCTGKVNAAYPGSGSAQACGVNDVRWLYDNQTNNNWKANGSSWIVARGDTVNLISAASIAAVPGLIAASAGPPNRIGWDYGGSCSGAGCGAGFTWCLGVGQCGVPPLPAGTTASPTHFWGSNHGACSTTTSFPGALVPTTIPDPAKMFEFYGDFGLNTTMDLTGTHDVDIQCVHVTTHGDCMIHISPNTTIPCSTSVPLSSYSSEGIRSGPTTGTVALTDVWISGFQDSGWFGPIDGEVTMNDVRMSYNVEAGFNMDNGTDSQAGGTVTTNNLTLDFNGCNQKWPFITTVPIDYCSDQSSAGDGDGVATPGVSSDTFINNHTTAVYNTQDGYDIGHNQDPGSASWNHSIMYGNMAGTFKSGGESASVINSTSVTNCYRMAAPIAGVPNTFNSVLTLFCRANGDGVGLNWLGGASGEVLKLQDNAIITYGGVAVDAQVQGAGSCTGCTFLVQGNVFLAYNNPSTGAPHNPGMYNLTSPGFGPTTTDHNTIFNFFGYTCTGSDQCVDPLFVAEPPPAPPVGNGDLDTFNFNLSASSPSKTSQIPIAGITDDFFGVTRLNPTSAGAAQFVTLPTVATPTASPVAGTYTSTQSVTLSTTTAGATICYTTDGSTPLAAIAGTCSHGTTYSGAITVAATTTIMAIGTLSGDNNSGVLTAVYTIVPPTVATPTASPVAGSYVGTQSVTLTDSTSGAAICYTIDGTTPTATTPGTCSHGTTYSGAITVSSSLTIMAIGTKAGSTNSALLTAAYTITPITVANPTASPGSGTYTSTQNVALSTTTGGATICYTLDSTTPTASGGVCSHGTTYSTAISVPTSTTIKAIGSQAGALNSAVVTFTYIINAGQPSTVTFGGQATFGQTQQK